MIRTYDSEPIAPVGEAGVALGSADIGPIDGEILAVHVDYDAACADTTVITVSTPRAPATPILTTPAGKTSKTFYPRAPLCDESGAPSPMTAATRWSLRSRWAATTCTWRSAGDPTAPVQVYVVVETLRPY